MAQGTVQVTHTGTSRWRRRTGEYASLAAALEAAADGDILTVAPGTYRENLVVQRAVTLRGPEGSAGSVRIAPGRRGAADRARLGGGAGPACGGPGRGGARAAGRGGHAGADRSADRHALGGRHRGARRRPAHGPALHRRQSGGRRHRRTGRRGRGVRGVRGGLGRAVGRLGARRRPSASGALPGAPHLGRRADASPARAPALEAVGCEVYEIRGSGVQIAVAARPRISPTATCTARPADGVTLDTDAVLTLADCEIHDIPENAVDLRSRSVLTLTRSTVRQFGRNGLSVWDPGTRVDANQCEIHDSTGDYPAVWVSDGATAVLDSCRVHDVPDALFVLDRGSRADVVDSDLSQVRNTAVSVSDGATAQLDDCRIREASTGAWFRDHGSGGTLNNCTIDARPDRSDRHQGRRSRRSSAARSTSPAEAGFYVSAEGRGTFRGCRVTGSGGYGFHVMDGCRTTLSALPHRAVRARRLRVRARTDGPVVEDCTSDESAGSRPAGGAGDRPC